MYGHPSKPKSTFKMLQLVKPTNSTEFEPEILFSPEQILNLQVSDFADGHEEISSVVDIVGLVAKVLLETIVEIAL